MTQLETDPILEVIEAIKNGQQVIMVDDVDRENEGDLVVSAELINEQHIAFMQKEARGLICVSVSREVAERLKLEPQTSSNSSVYQTAFTISVDSKEISAYGIEAKARAKTIRSIIDETSSPSDFITPGHVFPLVANPAGVLGRRGQTEGSHDLSRIAGLKPAGVICEILNPDGSMARGQQIKEFALQHKLKITSVADIVRYRINNEILVRVVAEATRPTNYGEFKSYVFFDDVTNKEHLVLVKGDIEELSSRVPLVRIHSECLTGDVFGSRRCDCGNQLNLSLKKIKEENAGLVIYLRQEGRGIGLVNKVKAYELQDEGLDTVEANLKLGFLADQRDFLVAAKILQYFNISKINLMTNNPDKIETIEKAGIKIEQRISVSTNPDPCSTFYMQTKKEKLGHIL